MSTRSRIGVACVLPGERAAFLEWLTSAGYEPVQLPDLDSVIRVFESGPLEALIADAALVPVADFPRVVHMLGINRPLVLVGEPGTAPEAVPRDATWVDRPVTSDSFLLSVALALAEGRPARRYPRKYVGPLLSSIDGVSSRVLDVSLEGIRLEVPGGQPSALPPYFTLRVPKFGVVTRVKRVWVASPGSAGVWCGGTLDRNAQSAITAWRSFVETVPKRSPAALMDIESVSYL